MDKVALLKLVKDIEIPSDAVHWKKILPENIEEQLRDAENNGRGIIRIRVEKIGRSREGRTIFGARISKHEDNPTICAIGNNHSEEVMGTFTSLFLIRKFAEDAEFQSILDDFSFSFVPQANPDGVVLNLEWIKKFFGSSTTSSEELYKEFLLHQYRDLREEDVEHGIPIEGTSSDIRPETNAVKLFIEDHKKIDYFISLHGKALSGGVLFYCYKEQNLDQLMNLVSNLSEELTLPLDFEDPAGYQGDKVIRDGFRTLPTFENMRAQWEKSGQKEEKLKKFKLNTVEYTDKRFSITAGLVTEIPLFYDKILASKERVCIPRYEVMRQIKVTEKEKYLKDFEKVLERLRNITSNRWLDYFSRLLDWEKISLDADKSPTKLEMFRHQDAYKSDIFNLITTPYLLNMRVSSAVLRTLEKNEEGKILREEYSQKFEENYEELIKRLSLEVIPPEKQIKLELASILGGMLVVI